MQRAASGRLARSRERVRADEPPGLSSLTQKPRPASYGVSSGVMSARPDAVALLEAQRVDRLVAARDEPVLAPRLPERAPQRRAVLRRAVELPAQLADERHAQRAHGHVADGDARARVM